MICSNGTFVQWRPTKYNLLHLNISEVFVFQQSKQLFIFKTLTFETEEENGNFCQHDTKIQSKTTSFLIAVFKARCQHKNTFTISHCLIHTNTHTHMHTLIFFFRKKVGGKGQTIHVRQKNIRKKAKWYFLFYPMTNCFLPPAILFLSFIVQPTNFYQKRDKMWQKINKGRVEISQLGHFYLW